MQEIGMRLESEPDRRRDPARRGDAAAALAGVPLFASLDAAALRALAGAGRLSRAGAGATVLLEGAPADSLVVVLAGRLRVARRTGDGEDVTLLEVGAGDYVGELALLDGGARSASVLALTPCRLFLLEREAFLALLSRAPPVLTAVLADLARHLRATSARVVDEEVRRRTLGAEMELSKYRALAQLVAGVAHELNTPLGLVNTAAGMVGTRVASETLTALATDCRSRTLLEEVREATALIQANIARAHRLVQDFRKLSVSQLADARERLDLVEVVEETVRLYSPAARQAKLRIRVRSRLPAGAGAAWLGYRGYLSQALLNLLTNVERYAYPEGAGGAVEIAIAADGAHEEARYLVMVRDFGRGVAPEDRPRVFEPFFTTGRARGGTGLGLAIVHGLVTSGLRGTVDFDSAPGQGTTVTLRFPQAIAG
jgi:signal transduction histidine kinase